MLERKLQLSAGLVRADLPQRRDRSETRFALDAAQDLSQCADRDRSELHDQGCGLRRGMARQSPNGSVDPVADNHSPHDQTIGDRDSWTVNQLGYCPPAAFLRSRISGARYFAVSSPIT